jgi:SOS-response transcriptional repressor LexA
MRLATLQNCDMKKRRAASKLTLEQIADQRRLEALVAEGPAGLQALVAADMDVSPSAVNQQISGHRPLNLRTATIFARRLQVPLDRISPSLAQKAAELFGNAVVVSTKGRVVPLISHVQAGEWNDASDSYPTGQGTEMLEVDFEVSAGSFALEVKGESMLPDFVEGDRIIVDPAVTPLPGDFVIAKNSEEGAMFKKYRPRGLNERGEPVFELVPLNNDYPTRYSDREQITIIGVMVEHRRRRRR